LVLGITAIVLVLDRQAEQSTTEQGPDHGHGTQEVEAIHGLTPADIQLHLDEWCLEFGGPRQILQLCLDQGEGSDPDTGILLTCEIHENTIGLDVAMVEFTVDAAALAQCQQVSPESVASLAARYLGHCATLPYDGAEPEVAEEWVQSKIAEAVGCELTATIGGVEFRLYGTDLIKALRLFPANGN